MGDSNHVLSQEDIDALVGKAIGKKPTPPAHANVSTETAPAKPKAPAIAAAPAAHKMVSATPAASAPGAPVVKAVASAPKAAKIQASNNGHHEECIAAGEIASLGKQIEELSSRMARIEDAITKLESKNTPTNQISPAQFKAALQQVQNVSSQVEIITEGLRGTAGYNLNKTFKCNSCGSLGVVAMKVKCTKCGQENWWGWWPKKK